MSSGDIDDKLGSAAQLQRYLETNHAFGEYMARSDSLPISRSAIPYGAGISTDGEKIYIDHRLNTFLNGVDVSPALAKHEATEWGLRKFCAVGVDYENDPMGHRLANRAELNKLEELMGEDVKNNPDNWTMLWEMYDDFLDPQIRAIEKAEIINPPQDLALYPYEWDARLLSKIKEAQLNALAEGQDNNSPDSGGMPEATGE